MPDPTDRPPFRLLSFVLPVFQEEDQIAVTIDAVERCGESLVESGRIGAFEVVCVDDGSTDGTAQILEENLQRERIRVATHPHNRGLGAALRTGIATAHGDCLLYTDSDLPYDLGKSDQALDMMSRSDDVAVCLYRNSRRGEGARRFLYSYVYNFLVRTALSIRVEDVNFAGKYFRAHAVDADDLRSEGSLIDVELIALILSSGATVEQFGVDYMPRSKGTSTLSSLGTIITILNEMLALGPALRRRAQGKVAPKRKSDA